jgi:hypothetical protein
MCGKLAACGMHDTTNTIQCCSATAALSTSSACVPVMLSLADTGLGGARASAQTCWGVHVEQGTGAAAIGLGGQQ